MDSNDRAITQEDVNRAALDQVETEAVEPVPPGAQELLFRLMAEMIQMGWSKLKNADYQRRISDLTERYPFSDETIRYAGFLARRFKDDAKALRPASCRARLQDLGEPPPAQVGDRDRVIIELVTGGPLSPDQIYAGLVERSVPINKSYLYTKLGKLAASGQICRNADGRYAHSAA